MFVLFTKKTEDTEKSKMSKKGMVITDNRKKSINRYVNGYLGQKKKTGLGV